MYSCTADIPDTACTRCKEPKRYDWDILRTLQMRGLAASRRAKLYQAAAAPALQAPSTHDGEDRPVGLRVTPRVALVAIA